ncbi:MAG: hypothetical protein HRT82_13730 [Henriciella sp.]|nr:hypothetical protein [Henriciella sp.]
MEVTIENIADVLPFVREDSGIIVSRRADHTVIDYVYTTNDMWDSDIALQCRGLKFDAAGKIIGRPFHKFFNIGEKQAPQDIAWDAPHIVLDKLDGSMVHPVYLNGELLFMTRKGATEHAKQAQSHAQASLLEFCVYCLDANLTPMFEFTSPNNRIVVSYDRPELTLLAVREMVSGRYLLYPELQHLARKFNVSLVQSLGTVEDFDHFIAEARAKEEIEGYVVVFDDGHRLKLKTEHYALRHNALASVTLEKNVLEWVLRGSVDDVLPLLAPKIAEIVRNYNDAVHDAITKREQEVVSFVNNNLGLSRKDFAAKAKVNLDPRLAGAAFAILDDRPPRKTLIDNLLKTVGSINRIDTMRDLYGFEWSLDGITLPEA